MKTKIINMVVTGTLFTASVMPVSAASYPSVKYNNEVDYLSKTDYSEDESIYTEPSVSQDLGETASTSEDKEISDDTIDSLDIEENALIQKDDKEITTFDSTESYFNYNENPTLIDSGLVGTCTWQLFDSGELIIGDGLLQWVGRESPFHAYRDQILHISLKNNLEDTAPSQVLGGANLANLFTQLHRVVNIDLRGLDTGDVTNMSYMFNGCSSLTELDVSGFDTGKVTNMFSMFNGCSSLTELDVSGFDTSNVTTMATMFSGCSSLTELDVSGFDTGNVTGMNSMFNGCSSLTELDVSGFDTSNVITMTTMFNRCSSLTELDVSGFDTSNVTNMSSMFNGCSSLTKLDVSGFDTSIVTNMSSMFNGCSSLTELDVSGFDTGNVTGMNLMFSSCSSLTELDVSGFDTSNVTTMSSMFNGCSSLTELDVSGFDTGNVTNMSSMFSSCSSLTELDVRGFDTSNVTTMSSMFSGCFSLVELDVRNFDTSNVITMSSMFSGCSSLTELDVSGFDTSNVINMSLMFNGCSSLPELNLRSFDTSSVTNMLSMFRNNNKLVKIKLTTNFRFSSNSGFAESPFSWLAEDGSSGVYTAADFASNFGSGNLTGGIYVAFIPYQPLVLTALTNNADLAALATVTQSLPQQPTASSYLDLTFSLNVTDHVAWSNTNFSEAIRLLDKDGNDLMVLNSDNIVVQLSETNPQIVQIILRSDLLRELGDNQIKIQLNLPLKNELSHIMPIINLESGFLHVPLAASHNFQSQISEAEALVSIPMPKGTGIEQVVSQGSSTADLDPTKLVENLTGSFDFDEVSVIGFKEEVVFDTQGKSSVVVVIKTDLGVIGTVTVPIVVMAEPSAYILLPERITLERSQDNRKVVSTEAIRYMVIDEIQPSVAIMTEPEVTLANKNAHAVTVQVYRENRLPLEADEVLATLNATQPVYQFHLEAPVSSFREVSSYQGTMVFNVNFVYE